MKKRILIGPLYGYVMSLIVLLLGTGFTTFLLIKFLNSGEIVALVFICGFFLYCTSSLFFLLFKFVYAEFDSEERLLYYGNFFFKKNIKIDQVTFGGQYLFIKNSLKVKTGDKAFYILCLDESKKKYLMNV